MAYNQSFSLLTQRDLSYAPHYDAGQYVQNPNSYYYDDVVTHIPLQRQAHQCNGYAYKTNQMIKHAYEDGNYGYTKNDMRVHARQMEQMSHKQAYLYAVGLGWQNGK